ncbi:MAG: tetratricopeptide repeat protein [Alphaproteobacteria bacterium]|nr:MAG: tetratricopeptide repeat protein [Alphaproteobacteria bacterium]
MVDIIQEAKEEARHEAIRHFLKKYATQIALVFVMIFSAVGGYSYWKNAQKTAAAEACKQYMRVLQDLQTASPEERQKSLKSLFDLKGYGALAKIIFGVTVLTEPDIKADTLSQEIDTLLNDKTMDDFLRDLLIVSLAQGMLNKNFTHVKLTEALNRIARANSFLRTYALETLALQDMSSGNTTHAAELLKQIENDATSPRQSRERAHIIQRQIASQESVLEQ